MGQDRRQNFIIYPDRHSRELEMVYSALDQLKSGIVLLDDLLVARFLNRAVREMWGISYEQAALRPSYVELVTDARHTGAYRVPPEELEKYIAARISAVQAGDPTPVDIPHRDGRMIRAQCSILPNNGRMVTYTDVTDLVTRATTFEQLATVDAMTGLYNRRHFETVAGAEWKRYQRYQRPLSMMLMDIDRFKQINDGFGHDVGDEAIKLVASVLAAEKRSSDTAARLGGDEFVVLLPETELPQARRAAERLRLAINAKSDESNCGNVKVPITVSIGVASASLPMAGYEALMRQADKGLYVAKAAGRNCTGCAEEPAIAKPDVAAE